MATTNKAGTGRVLFHIILGLCTCGIWWGILALAAVVKYLRN